MTLEEAYEVRRQECLTLQRTVKVLTSQLDSASKGLFTPTEKTQLIKQNVSLKFQLDQAIKDRDTNHAMWLKLQTQRWTEDFKRTTLETKVDELTKENAMLKQELETLKTNSSTDKDATSKINTLKDEICRLNAIININGANSSIPTSQTPFNKKKVIPNSRTNYNRLKGGQLNHAKHSLPAFANNEITDTALHTLEECSVCGGPLIETGERYKDEADFEVRLIKRRHVFKEYQCLNCGIKLHPAIPKHLKEANQYGSSIQTLILSLLNLGFVSINRTRKLVSGMLGNEFLISDGYISKLQSRYSRALAPFVLEVKSKCIAADILYWDDTVVYMNKQRGCMRFYGNEGIALFTAHPQKNREGIDQDGILELLSDDTVVMHDHNTINYNTDFRFKNVECNQHLQRNLQKLYDISTHDWALQLKSLIAHTIHKRKAIISQSGSGFEQNDVDSFFSDLESIMKKAEEDSAKDHNHYFATDERRLINCINKFRLNYFNWVTDFNIPTTNNLSERSLRAMKTHAKVSGQFTSSKTAQSFADIRSYLETCARNGVNEFRSLSRLSQGKPYLLSELFDLT